MVTHSLQQAVALGDRVVLMHQGRIVQTIGAPGKRAPGRETARQLRGLRSADLVNQSSADMAGRLYIDCGVNRVVLVQVGV